MDKINVFWFRRDLRIDDNHALYESLISANKTLPIFIFDRNIVEDLPENDARITFIYEALQSINKQCKEAKGSIKIYNDTPENSFRDLVSKYNIDCVFTNDDYEPYALKRDDEIKTYLNSQGIKFVKFKDHVIFEKSEVVKADNTPYLVYTPYSKKWKSLFTDKVCNAYPSQNYLSNLYVVNEELPSLGSLGFVTSELTFPKKIIDKSIVENYNENRDFPSIEGTSRLGLHLRFGTLSIRSLIRKLPPKNEKFLNELIWRDFYQMILFHFPQTTTQAFKAKYDQIEWRNNKSEFEAWKKGETGYFMVDAGMRELNQTGFMHNRVRMVVASFLTKHLLIDWRWGEAYFAEKLLDFDLASNVGGWQWAAGCGVDAAPYFRVFNPDLQLKKFDPEMKYVKKWVPEWNDMTYPQRIVDHKMARERAIKTYKEGLSNN